jgi:Pentapeptide repeats (8 copies)
VANPEHLAKLIQGVEAWNQWREENIAVSPDLSEAGLGGADLSGAILSRVNLSRAKLSGAILRAFLFNADLSEADLRGADLRGANLSEAILFEVKLSRAKLSGAILSEADLTEADLHGADLELAQLIQATLVGTNLEGANLANCVVHGISVWNVRLEGAIQSNLVITPLHESPISVDNLEVAQFVYLLLNNERIRHVIDTITSKVVLILGRFTPERKVILDAIREELRKRDYLPVLFDFEKPSSRDLTETVRTLAHMARFVIADITDAKSIPQELIAIVPNLPSVPVQPLLLASQHEYGMFEHLRRFPWVLEPLLYDSQEALLMELESKVIVPAEAKANEQIRKRL